VPADTAVTTIEVPVIDAVKIHPLPVGKLNTPFNNPTLNEVGIALEIAMRNS
jgi:hypothetical protein